MKVDLVKFLTTYLGLKPQDFDGMDGYSIDEHTLEAIVEYAMDIQKDPSFLDVLVKDAIVKGLWKEQQ